MTLFEAAGKWLGVVERCLAFVRENESNAESGGGASSAQLEQQQQVFEQRVRSSLADMTRQMEDLAQSVVTQVSQKIESDELEKLAGNIKAVQLAVQLGDPHMLGSGLVTLSTNIEYAKRRLAEGKSWWLQPWMLAESTRISAILTKTDGEQTQKTVRQLALDFRLQILHCTGVAFVQSQDNPKTWQQIAAFVEGRDEHILGLIGRSIPKPSAQIAVYVQDLEDLKDFKVVDLLVKPGEHILSGQTVIVAESQKATVEIPSPHEGVVIEIKVSVGDELKNGSLLLYVENTA